MVTGDWGVRADDLLGHCSAVWEGLREGSGDGDVLADWETEDGGWGWEGEAVDCGVVGEDCFFGELEFLEFLLENWLGGGVCLSLVLSSSIG